LSDPHGTGQVTVDSVGFAVTRRDSDPYGNELGAVQGGSWPDQHGFLGKPKDDATGLTDVGARNYDPVAGRFISVDPVMEASSPQQINGYAYAGNNPVTNSDPTGLCNIDQDSGMCGTPWTAPDVPPPPAPDVTVQDHGDGIYSSHNRRSGKATINGWDMDNGPDIGNMVAAMKQLNRECKNGCYQPLLGENMLSEWDTLGLMSTACVGHLVQCSKEFTLAVLGAVRMQCGPGLLLTELWARVGRKVRRSCPRSRNLI
jgi:RHS repeat-associated protein